MEDLIEFVIMKVFFPLIIVVLLGLVFIVLPYAIYQRVVSDKLTLIASEWKCTSEVQDAPLYVQSGNTMIPIPSSHCVKYEAAK